MNNKLKKTVNSAFDTARKIAIFCAVLRFCPAFAAQDLYFNYNTSTGNPARELAVAGNWYADADRTEPFTGTLGADCDGIVNSSGAINTATNAYLELNSLTYIVADAGASATSDLMLVLRGGDIRLIEDFNFDISVAESAASNVYNGIRLASNRNISVGGDLNINYDQKGERYYIFRIMSDDGAASPASINVAGNVNITSANSSPLRVTTSVANFTVNGIMNIGNTSWTATVATNNTAEETYLSRVIGGLSSGGLSGEMLASMNGGIEFKNASACEWIGTFGTNDGAEFNILMNADNAQNGAQTLRLTGKRSGAAAADLNEVTVSSGRLNLGMHSGMKGNRLSIIGANGTFSPTGIDSSEIGTATFAEGDWYEGKIALDIEGEFYYDKIVFEGNLEKTGNNISLELSFDEYTIAELIGASESGDEFILSDMIAYATGSSIEGTVLRGSSGKINWEAIFGESSMSVVFSAVPEPSEIAAVFGAIALAFAIRQRKRN